MMRLWENHIQVKTKLRHATWGKYEYKQHTSHITIKISVFHKLNHVVHKAFNNHRVISWNDKFYHPSTVIAWRSFISFWSWIIHPISCSCLSPIEFGSSTQMNPLHLGVLLHIKNLQPLLHSFFSLKVSSFFHSFNTILVYPCIVSLLVPFFFACIATF